MGWLRYDSRSGTHNMYREYRDLTVSELSHSVTGTWEPDTEPVPTASRSSDARLWRPASVAVLWSSRCMTPRSSSLSHAESRSREVVLSRPTDQELTSSRKTVILFLHLLLCKGRLVFFVK